MSVPEVAFRIRRTCRNQVERLARPGKRWPEAQVPDDAQELQAEAPNVNTESYLSAADEILAGRLVLFSIVSEEYGENPNWNQDPKSVRNAPLYFGKTLDYRDESLVGDIKYLWEPNRHYHLVTLAQAYALSGRASYAMRIRSHVESWIQQCPYGLGPNWCSSLELGIRLINWWLTWRLIGGLNSPIFSGDSGIRFRNQWLESIYQHVTFIQSFYSRYSSANNHLIGEAAAVAIATSIWPYWASFASAGSKAREILAEECLKQNHEDGVNKEQAIWYQQFVLNFLILAGTCTHESPTLFPARYWDRIEAMLEFIAAMRDHEGNMPMFGDADDGVVCKLDSDPGHCPFASLLEQWAFLTGRSDFRISGQCGDETAWLACIAGGFQPMSRSNASPRSIPTDFPHGGYYVISSESPERPKSYLVLKAGPLGFGPIAAHGHADALSVYLTVDGQEILIDPGTYAYHTGKKWRNYFRGTSAHNTVRIDGLDQSVIGGNFLWTRHANARIAKISSNQRAEEVTAQHDGYSRLKRPVFHRRTVSHQKPHRAYIITDEILGSDQHGVEIYFHFAENCRVREVENSWEIVAGNTTVIFTFDEHVDSVSLHKGDSDLPLGWISRSFGAKSASPTIICSTATKLPSTFITKIEY